MNGAPRVVPVAHAEEGFDLHLTEEQAAAASRVATESLKGLCPAIDGPRARIVEPPAGPESEGEPGDRAVSGGYIYFCVGRRKWRRATLN